VIANNEKGVRVTRGGGTNMKPQVAVQAPVTSINKVLPEDRFLKRVADTHELIARRAYELFSASGFTHGHDLEDWLGAESEILQPVPFEVTETPDAINVKGALPGFSAEDIEIHVEPQRLFISGQQQEKSEEKKGKSIRSEQRLTRVFRSLDLPAQIDPEKVRATLSNSELQIELPKITADRKVTVAAKAAA